MATRARVTASLIVGAATLSSQSSQLTISTDIPDQNSISISTTSPLGVTTYQSIPAGV